MPTQRFSTEAILRSILAEALKAHDDLDEHLLSDWYDDAILDSPIIGSEGFENIHQCVFELEGKHWAFKFEMNDGAGYNAVFGSSDPITRPPLSKEEDGSWTFHENNVERKSFHCYEVRKVEQVMVVWEKV